MQLIKRSVLIVVCITVILSTFIPCSLASYSEEEHQAMLDEGFTYDPYLNVYYIGEEVPMMDDGYIPYISTTPNFPDFNPNMVPWESAPQEVKDILYDTPFIMTTTTSYPSKPWKIPFVLVLTDGSIVRVCVGVNLMLATYFATQDDANNFIPTGSYIVCEVLDANANINPGVEYACYYEARFDFQTMKTIEDWRSVDPVALGNRFSRFTASLLSTTSSWDYYFYGGNNIGPGLISQSFSVNTGESGYPRLRAVTSAASGFAGGSFVFNQAGYPFAHMSAFIPQNFESQQLETSKGIWATLKEVPGNIINGITNSLSNMLNYLLYFQKEKPAHTNPFSDVLNDIKTFFTEQMSDVARFKTLLSYTLDDVVGYIETGSGAVQSILTGIPVLSAFVTFFVVFCVVRKVIGR